MQEARSAFEEALELNRERGDAIPAGRALTTLNVVLPSHLGETRAEQVMSEAVSLLEAEPHGEDLVAAYAELSATRWIAGAYTDAIAAAEQALRLAAESACLSRRSPSATAAGLARTWANARARGHAPRARAGDRARPRPRGRCHPQQSRPLHWPYEGPEAAAAACREGIDFSERRGITEQALATSAQSSTFRAAAGHAGETLADAEPLAAELEAQESVDAFEARSVQLRLLAQRGEHVHTTIENAQTLVADARAGIQAAFIAMALAAVAELFMASGRPEHARRLLAEVDELDHNDAYYIAYLPGLVRVAVALESAELVARLVSGVEPHTPLAEHALCACRASLSESAGEHADAAASYAEAAERWREFGDVPERAYALLGQGRCLRALGEASGGPAPGSSRALRVDGLRSGARRGRRPSGARQGRGAMTIKPPSSKRPKRLRSLVLGSEMDDREEVLLGKNETAVLGLVSPSQTATISGA